MLFLYEKITFSSFEASDPRQHSHGTPSVFLLAITGKLNNKPESSSVNWPKDTNWLTESADINVSYVNIGLLFESMWIPAPSIKFCSSTILIGSENVNPPSFEKIK